ncbi:MAG: hypothetical protein ACO32I_06200 [Candidatus Limnocylindrus sp.]
MLKTAKSKVVKIVEQKLRDGDREGAMKLLREAEAADRTGAFTVKEIKGLHDDPSRVYGGGQFGVVRDRFYDGKMLPAKELRSARSLNSDEIGIWGGHAERVALHNQEAVTNRRVANLVKNDPELRALGVRTPQYYGNNANKMVGQSFDDLSNEYVRLKGLGSKANKQERGRLKAINHMVARKQDYQIDSRQVQPMSHLPEKAPHRNMIDKYDVEQRGQKAMRRLEQLGWYDSDKSVSSNHNVRIGAPQAGSNKRPIYLYDFGLGSFDDRHGGPRGNLTKTLGAPRPSSMIAGKLPTGTAPSSLKRVSSYVPAHLIQRMRALGYRSR